ncbi:MAG: cold shock domain-containing protein [Acidimicrobiales bacterium]
MSAAVGRRLEGRVEEFDDHVGLGTVASVDGRSFRFHCTQIADGTRTITAGESVTFAVAPGGAGSWEAFDVARG